MSTRKIYILIVVLGLAMVWLGFLFTYELQVVQPMASLTEHSQQEAPAGTQLDDEHLQSAGIDSGTTVTEAGAGFPLVLAGLGVVFVLGGVANYRHRE